MRLSPSRTLLVAGLLAGLAATPVIVATGAAAAPSPTADMPTPTVTELVPPEKDPFYRYQGKTPLAKIPHGTALAQRSVTLGLASGSTPLPAQQILYRTTDGIGKPVLSVTTVVLPVTGTIAPKVAAYLSFYDALTSLCDPSYELRGGNPGASNESTAAVEQTLVEALRAAGDIVTVPDFENERLDYVAGTESGMSTLDGITATLSVLGLDTTTTPIGMMGYSGGSIAADWAAELAPRYAPKLKLVGVAMGGVPVHLGHNLRYIDGTPSWSDVMPAALLGITRSFHIDFDKYLSPYGKKIVNALSDQCIGEFQGAYPNLKMTQLVKHCYHDVFSIPVFRRTVNKLIMGSVPGHPVGPFYMAAGIVDGIGDGVMIEQDQQQLAYEYCHQGVAVNFQQLKNLEHVSAGGAFFPQAILYLQERFLGLPPENNCDSIQRGNSLAPLR